MIALMKNLIHRATIQPFSVVLALIILVSGQGNDRSPIISYISPNQIKHIGETVKLACKVHHVGDYPVLWNKVSRVFIPISTKTAMIVRNERFTTTFDPENSAYTLEIQHLQETDEGLYRCQIPISVNEILQTDVEVRVLRPPLIDDSSTKSEVAFEGQRVTLKCFANGYPKPEIWWRRPDNGVLPTGKSVYKGNTLEFPSVSLNDSAVYYCSASNRYSESVQRKIPLEVRPLRSLIKLRHSSRYFVESPDVE